MSPPQPGQCHDLTPLHQYAGKKTKLRRTRARDAGIMHAFRKGDVWDLNLLQNPKLLGGRVQYRVHGF